MNHTGILHNGGAMGIMDITDIATIHSTGAGRLLVVSTMPMKDLIMGHIAGMATIKVVVVKASERVTAWKHFKRRVQPKLNSPPFTVGKQVSQKRAASKQKLDNANNDYNVNLDS